MMEQKPKKKKKKKFTCLSGINAEEFMYFLMLSQVN